MFSKQFKIALAIAGGAGALAASAAQAQTFRYSQWLPVGHFSQVGVMHPYFKDIEKATEGRVKIQPTAKGLGAPPRQYQLAIDGIADEIGRAHV